MQTESFGPVSNPDGSPSETTKDFARANPMYCFAWITVPPRGRFPFDMLRYDGCEFSLSAYQQMARNLNDEVDAGQGPMKPIGFMVRREHASRVKWTPERWRSFGVEIEII